MQSAVLLLAAGLLIAPDDPNGGGHKATNEILGAWQKDAREVWEVDEEKIVVTLHGIRAKTKEERVMKYRLDREKSPKEIDVTHVNGPVAGKTVKGIYKVEKDTLTICLIVARDGAEKKPRPTDFTKGKDAVVLKFDRSVKRVREWMHREAVQVGAAPRPGQVPGTDPLLKEAPKTGYVANEKAWAKLWKAWRGKEELPKVDFEKQLVLVRAVPGAMNMIDLDLKLSEKGELKGDFKATEIGGPGFAYLIVVIDRAGIKSYNGKIIDKE